MSLIRREVGSPENPQNPEKNTKNLKLLLKNCGLSETLVTQLTPKITDTFNKGLSYSNVAFSIESVFDKMNPQGTPMSPDYQAAVSEAVEEALEGLTQK